MGLDKSLFGYANFRKLLDEVDCFLNEHLLHNLFLSFHHNK